MPGSEKWFDGRGRIGRIIVSKECVREVGKIPFEGVRRLLQGDIPFFVSWHHGKRTDHENERKGTDGDARRTIQEVKMTPDANPEEVRRNAFDSLQRDAGLSLPECQFYDEEIKRCVDEKRTFTAYQLSYDVNGVLIRSGKVGLRYVMTRNAVHSLLSLYLDAAGYKWSQEDVGEGRKPWLYYPDEAAACLGWLPGCRPLPCCNWLHRLPRANTAANAMRRWICGSIFVGGRVGPGARSRRRARPAIRTLNSHGDRSICGGAGPMARSGKSRKRTTASLKRARINSPRRIGIGATHSVPTPTAVVPAGGRLSAIMRADTARPAGRRSTVTSK